MSALSVCHPSATVTISIRNLLSALSMLLFTFSSASAQTFDDVSVDHWAASFVEILAGTGISSGCGDSNYCPDEPVTRAQMAVFLERGMNGSGYVPPAASGAVFLDVDSGDFAAAFIEQLYADGITAGCGNNNYCPVAAVTRAQMAVFLLRAKYGSSYSPAAATGVFNDLDTGYWAAPWIEALAAEGITAGCGNGTFCPEDAVTRAQMAVFLVRTFDLSLPNEEVLTLHGIAGDTPLANAHVSATVYTAGSDGGSSSVFSATADVQGSFTIDVSVASLDDFILLMAEGTGAQQGITLASYLGSAAYVADQVVGGSSTVTVSENGALEISHVSTAMAVLAEKSHGGPIFSANDLSEAESRIVGPELFNMAAAIKTLVDNAAVVLPVSFDNSLDLLRDHFEYSGFFINLQTNHVQELELAALGIGGSLQQGFSIASLPGVTYFALRDYELLRTGALALQLNADASGEVIDLDRRSDVTWSVDILGRVILDILNPAQEVSTIRNPNDDPADPSDDFITALTYTDRVTIKRLGDGISMDPVLLLKRVVTTYPINPELPDSVEEVIASPTRVYTAFRAEDLRPFTASEIVGTTVAAGYHHGANATTHNFRPQYGIEPLSFFANGSGITDRTLRAFVWTIDEDGALVVRFANGDTTTILRYSQDGLAGQNLIRGDLADGTASIIGGEMVKFDGVSEFSEAMLVNRRYRSVGAVIDNELEAFDFLHFPGGEGCRIMIYDGEQSFADIEWWSTASNTMDSMRYYPSEPAAPWNRRAWELIAIESGIFGDRYWVIENLEVSDFDLAYDWDWDDPAVTPGRINAYEFIQDLTGQTNPCDPPPPQSSP